MSPKRNEGEESEYPFFEGDGSFSAEWGGYGVGVTIMKDLHYLTMINMKKNRCQFIIPILKMSLKKKDLSGMKDLVGKKTTSKTS
nr:hypothetical protein [Tanacetum cinerariifolium]GEZ46164.1 hypothetical protein [Tanacetum cinerariifolium]